MAKGMSTGTKVMLGVGVLAAAGIGFYFWKKNQAPPLNAMAPANLHLANEQQSAFAKAQAAMNAAAAQFK